VSRLIWFEVDLCETLRSQPNYATIKMSRSKVTENLPIFRQPKEIEPQLRINIER